MVKFRKNILTFYLFLLLGTESCDIISNKKYIEIDPKIKIDMVVNSAEVNRGLILNGKYKLNGAFFLINKNKIPKWILTELKQGYSFHKNNYGEVMFDISDLNTPYKINKHINSNIFYLIRNNDTLKFIL